VKETQRHKLGKLLGTRTRNFLLMSATPHNGKEADFQLFMGLLASWHVRRARRALRQGYALMGEALKARVEAQWRDRAGSPTSVGS